MIEEPNLEADIEHDIRMLQMSNQRSSINIDAQRLALFDQAVDYAAQLASMLACLPPKNLAYFAEVYDFVRRARELKKCVS